jgi:hypothetical protein
MPVDMGLFQFHLVRLNPTGYVNGNSFCAERRVMKRRKWWWSQG